MKLKLVLFYAISANFHFFDFFFKFSISAWIFTAQKEIGRKIILKMRVSFKDKSNNGQMNVWRALLENIFYSKLLLKKFFFSAMMENRGAICHTIFWEKLITGFWIGLVWILYCNNIKEKSPWARKHQICSILLWTRFQSKVIQLGIVCLVFSKIILDNAEIERLYTSYNSMKAFCEQLSMG